MGIDPESIRSEEGAITMDVSPGADNMTFVVDCASHQPPRLQLDEIGAQTPMTEVTPPASPDAGVYQDTVVFTAKGGHSIICFNGSTRVRQSVFAGDYPAWRSRLVDEQVQDPIEDAAAIGATTGKLG